MFTVSIWLYFTILYFENFYLTAKFKKEEAVGDQIKLHKLFNFSKKHAFAYMLVFIVWILIYLKDNFINKQLEYNFFHYFTRFFKF